MVSKKLMVFGKLVKGIRAEDMPVLVGGGAVEVYTRGYFTTGDMDILASKKFKEKLIRAGFEDYGGVGRIFVKDDVVIDVVGSYTKRRTKIIKIGGTPYRFKILSIEDIIVDRLCACEFWKSPRDCEQARFLLKAYHGRLDSRYLKKRAMEEGVVKKLKALEKT